MISISASVYGSSQCATNLTPACLSSHARCSSTSRFRNASTGRDTIADTPPIRLRRDLPEARLRRVLRSALNVVNNQIEPDRPHRHAGISATVVGHFPFGIGTATE